MNEIVASANQQGWQYYWRRLWTGKARRSTLAENFGKAVALVSLLSGLATYVLLTERFFRADNFWQFYWLIGIDVALLLAMTIVIASRALKIWRRSKQKLAGAQLHIQLMGIFSALAALPAVLVALFAVVFVHFAVQAWFGEQIRTAVTESQAVAQSYLEEHQQTIRADLLAMAGDLNRASVRLSDNPEALREFFRTQAYLRNLSEAVLLTSSGDVVERAGLSFSLEFLPENFQSMIKQADDGQVVLFVGENEDRVRALVKLDNYIDTYLFVGRFVEEKVLSRVTATTDAVNAYEALQARQTRLKVTMTVIFALVALMLLLIAVWAGLTLAERIVGPISRLIQAAERVRAGDLNARVEEDSQENEIGTLARAFNRMTDQLSLQRKDLIAANRQLDERRRFTETVLAGVNAGILGMDSNGVIQVTNASACKLLKLENHEMIGKKLADICPEIEIIRRLVRSKPGRSIETPVTIKEGSNDELHWIVRMTNEAEGEQVRGFVATFDDLSPLIDAQRKAAWADVARRVAHEIKNPLTPIQLSAERLKRRYTKQISEDVETFAACTDTIIRQVDDIRRMVDEFSSFARMPASEKRAENLVTICRQAIVLFQQSQRDVAIVFDPPQQTVTAIVDRQQIGQVMTNLIKNAVEALQDANVTDPKITVILTEDAHSVQIEVTDNGPGWPKEILSQLADPYVTTKETGTGLGLAITAKIIEDHHGKMDFADNTPHGAIVRLRFPKGEIQNG